MGNVIQMRVGPDENYEKRSPNHPVYGDGKTRGEEAYDSTQMIAFAIICLAPAAFAVAMWGLWLLLK
jgi:hypothetical protein